MNELIWLLLLTVDFGLAIGAYKFFGKEGLYAVIATSIILANIQVLKTVAIFGFVTTLGNVMYGGIFLVTDILSEKYGKDAAKKGVWIGFYSLLSMTLLMQIALWFVPDASDFAHSSLNTLFSLMPRVAFGSIIAYLISQHHDVWAFHYWKKKTKGKYLWLRNNASTWVSQLIDTAIFCSIAFIGLWSWDVWWQVCLTTYFFKIIVAALDTPMLYIAKRIKVKS